MLIARVSESVINVSGAWLIVRGERERARTTLSWNLLVSSLGSVVCLLWGGRCWEFAPFQV